MSFLHSIRNAFAVVFDAYFPTDLDLISPEAKQILGNPEDKKKYLDAIDRMREGSKREILVLHNGKELTLVS